MLTVKFLKYAYNSNLSGPPSPNSTTHIVLHPARAVFVEVTDVHGRSVVGVEHPTTREVERFTVSGAERDDVMFNVAYVMNDAGKTVETIR